MLLYSSHILVSVEIQLTALKWVFFFLSVHFTTFFSFWRGGGVGTFVCQNFRDIVNIIVCALEKLSYIMGAFVKYFDDLMQL